MSRPPTVGCESSISDGIAAGYTGRSLASTRRGLEVARPRRSNHLQDATARDP
ncbi:MULTISPECIES: hypothetical protein [unclassified Natrinema]|uniref:hypothetical protein n=1 Tax=unclassified Natrinema TaxID=2622230 RepID=UPI00026D4939|nr:MULTISPECIES: hypothetical protein [unclassified Natrinema]AFO56362.1 hypothetical protein NJ7G_1115 [Natrinema sp. J7-2]